LVSGSKYAHKTGAGDSLWQLVKSYVTIDTGVNSLSAMVIVPPVNPSHDAKTPSDMYKTPDPTMYSIGSGIGVSLASAVQKLQISPGITTDKP
jgi:hypothetical protein